MQQFLTHLFRDQSYDEKSFFLIAGPCVIESEELIMEFVATWVYPMSSRHRTGKRIAPAAAVSLAWAMKLPSRCCNAPGSTTTCR